MNIRTVCLALLAHGEASGYDLKKRWADGPFAHFVDASFGSIYPSLARLESEGLVACREEAQSGKPSRKVYTITLAGREALVEAMSEPPGPDTFRSPFGVVAMCAPFLPRDVVVRIIDERIKESALQVKEMEGLLQSCAHPPLRWLLEWGLNHYRNEVTFLRERRGALEDIAGRTDLVPTSIADMMVCCESDEVHTPRAGEA